MSDPLEVCKKIETGEFHFRDVGSSYALCGASNIRLVAPGFLRWKTCTSCEAHLVAFGRFLLAEPFKHEETPDSMKKIDEAVAQAKTVVSDLIDARDVLVRKDEVRNVIGYLIHLGHKEAATSVGKRFFPDDNSDD